MSISSLKYAEHDLLTISELNRQSTVEQQRAHKKRSENTPDLSGWLHYYGSIACHFGRALYKTYRFRFNNSMGPRGVYRNPPRQIHVIRIKVKAPIDVA